MLSLCRAIGLNFIAVMMVIGCVAPAQADGDFTRKLLGLGLRAIIDSQKNTNSQTRQPQASRNAGQASAPQVLSPAKALQSDLARIGYDVGSIDGVLGQRTRNAVRQWQSGHAMPATGKLSPLQRELLRADVLRKEGQTARGDIYEVQANLNALGHTSGAPDGVWGARSQAALDAWRRSDNRNASGALTAADQAGIFQMAHAGAGKGGAVAPDSGGAAANIGSGPSFNCARATTATEGAICGSADLAALDRKMADVWADLAPVTEALRGSQRVWIAKRNACGADVVCLNQTMSSRIRALQEKGKPQRVATAPGVLRPMTNAQKIQQGINYRGCVQPEAFGDVDLSTCASFDRYVGVDIPGFDIRSPFDDPLLQNLSQEQCASLCFATENCGAFTLNKEAGGYCFLKSYDGAAARYGGAVSGVLRGVAAVRPVFTHHPKAGEATYLPDMSRRADKNQEQHIERVQVASQSAGGSCDLERAQMTELAAQAVFGSPNGTTAAGQPVDIGWSMPAPDVAMPLWISASGMGTMRIGGDGFTLGPDATGPFGMQVGRGETRSMLLLRPNLGPSAHGIFQITPLVAQPTKVTLRVVGWLRACRQQVVLREETRTLDVAPAPAEIILTTAAGAAGFTHAVDLPKWDRRVEFNETRLRILSGEGAEIRDLVGRDLLVSPTRRFLTIRQGNAWQVVDVIDGAVLGGTPANLIYWGAGDSVFITTSAPWARIDILAPFSGEMLIKELQTGPSCCPAMTKAMADGQTVFQSSGVPTHVSVDTQNWTVSVLGGFGDTVRSLDKGTAVHSDDPGNAYAAGGEVSPARTALIRQGLAPLAPFSIEYDFDIAGDLAVWDFLDLGDDVAQRLARVGLMVETLEHEATPLILASLDGAFRGTATDMTETLTSQLERIGLSIIPGLQDADLITQLQSDPEFAGVYGWDLMDRFRSKHAQVFTDVERDAKQAGHEFQWLDGEEDRTLSRECYHVGTNEGLGMAGAPIDLQQISRIQTPTGPIYVGRAFCRAGATFGSLRHSSAFIVMDFSATGDPARSYVLEEGFGMANTYTGSWWDKAFRSRLYDRHLLIYTPGFGAISLRDLDTGRALWTTTATLGGDLLASVWLTEDHSHAVQLNEDGALHVYRISDGVRVLSGRISEDEVAVWTDDFRFDATAEAAGLIDLRFPGVEGQFSLDRFGATRRVQGLVASVLKGENTPVTPVSVPPVLLGRIIAKGENIGLEARFETGRAAQTLEVYQDGVLTDTINLAGASIAITVPRLTGARWAAMVARSLDGTASREVFVDLGVDPRGGTTIRSLLVGVDVYDDPRLQDLNYAKADVGRMQETLLSPAVGASSPRLLTKSAATPAAILKAVRQTVEDMAPEDHAVLFFAGHGLRGADGGFYFGTSATDLDNLPATALAWRDIAAIVANAPGRVTVLLDACHAGAADSGAFATNDDAVAGLSSIPANVTILSASKGRQLSAETSAVGGGLFTAALAQVLAIDRLKYDTDGNGRIETTELYQGVKAWVQAQPGTMQTPWMTRTRMVGSYALF